MLKNLIEGSSYESGLSNKIGRIYHNNSLFFWDLFFDPDQNYFEGILLVRHKTLKRPAVNKR